MSWRALEPCQFHGSVTWKTTVEGCNGSHSHLHALGEAAKRPGIAAYLLCRHSGRHVLVSQIHI